MQGGVCRFPGGLYPFAYLWHSCPQNICIGGRIFGLNNGYMSSPASFRASLQSRLEQLREAGLYRSLPAEGDFVDFCSNDYLGFVREPLVMELPGNSNSVLPSGATGSRLISGNSRYFEELEQEIARFHGAEAGLIFSSGYLANLALLSALPHRHDVILYDQLIHASLRDGIRLSGARHFSFRHNDLDHLEQRLRKIESRALIVVESIYSMDGDRAPLRELVELAERFNAAVIVDEAHSVGIDGANGEGLVSELGLEARVMARTVTFGKVLGCHGAAVIGDALLKDFMVNCARGFIYTTAMAPRTLLDIRQAYAALPLAGARRRLLSELSAQFSLISGARERWTPIHQIQIPGNHQVMRAAADLREAGFAVVAIRSPTVPAGSERIRICLHSFNTAAQLSQLAVSIKQVMGEQGA